jgi:hypothetical protein
MELEDQFQIIRTMYCPPNEYIHVPEGRPPPELPRGGLKGTWLEFQILLYHGEHDLAWDALFDIGMNRKLPSSYWESLIEIAAVEFKDKERVMRAQNARDSVS